MELMKGIIPPVITPMNPDESVNLDELRRQIGRLIDAGVHGIFVLGTNGESFVLEEKEKISIIKTAVETVKGRVPVYAGTGCVSTRETVRLSKTAEDLGADCLSVITPYFAAASQEELYRHYRTVAESVGIPVVLYNIPMRCQNRIEPETVRRLAEIDNVRGAKDSSGDLKNMLAYLELTRGMDFSVLSGNDGLILENLKAGGTGGIAGCANVFPHNMVEIYQAFCEGDLQRAEKAQQNISVFRSAFRYGNPNTIVKMAVNLLGHPVGPCRAPFNSLSDEGTAYLKHVLEESTAMGMS